VYAASRSSIWLVLAVDILSTCQMNGLMVVPWIK
jgi:hypothetical protein